MVSYEYDLGEIKHVKLDSNLKLTTQCRIKFSSSCALVFPFSKFFQNLDTLITSDAWITRGNGLQVSFQLLTDELASYYFDRSAFVDDLRVILLNAEIWTQLGLNVGVVISHKDGSIGVPLEDFVLSISHSKTMKISTVKPEKNMLSGPGPMSPPWGVPIIFLDDIKLIFRISNSWNMRQLDTTSTDRLYLDMLLAAIEHLEPAFKNQGMLLDDPLLFSKSAWIQLDLNDTASAKSSFNPKTGFIASFPTGFPLAVPQINIFAQKVDCDFPVMRPQIECAMQSSAREKEFVIDLVKLVDAGFRTILTKDKPQLHSGLSMAISCDGPKLLEIAPAVFNPDYLRKFSEHSQLNETIASTVSMIYLHNKSSRLQRKFEGLMSFQHEEYFRESGQSIDYPQDANGQLVNAVNVHLWRLLQSRLTGFTGVGKLKPLNWTDYLSDRSLDQQEMLDEENQDDPWGLMDSSSETANELLISEEEEMLEETGYYELYSFEKGVTKEICPLDHDLFWDDEDIFRDEPESLLIYEDDN